MTAPFKPYDNTATAIHFRKLQDHAGSALTQSPKPFHQNGVCLFEGKKPGTLPHPRSGQAKQARPPLAGNESGNPFPA